MHWYLIHTKPRQEKRALDNLTQQGYECYLPLYHTEKLQKGKVNVIQEALFPRYLFIKLSTSQEGQSWAPIRSTLGVHRLVTFGLQPAKVGAELVDLLKEFESSKAGAVDKLYNAGDAVQIIEGPFAGLPAIYHIAQGERRAMVLIELLHRPVKMTIDNAQFKAA